MNVKLDRLRNIPFTQKELKFDSPMRAHCGNSFPSLVNGIETPNLRFVTLLIDTSFELGNPGLIRAHTAGFQVTLNHVHPSLLFHDVSLFKCYRENGRKT